MIKTLCTAAVAVGLISTASAGPLPAPPTQAFTPETRSACETETLTIYFAPDSSDLSRFAQDRLELAAQNLSDCRISQIDADLRMNDAKTLAAQNKLSQDRVSAVFQFLSKRGVSNSPTTTTLQFRAERLSVSEPVGQRVTVSLTAYPQSIS